MKWILLFFVVLLVGCAKAPEAPSGFCGSSTQGACSSDSDCVTDGCSGQICRAASEEGLVTTCEWKDCYDDEVYGVSCGCVDQQCAWE